MIKKGNNMKRDKKIPVFKNYKEMVDFWETHSLADYWEQTEPAEFEISEKARHRYLVSIDKVLLEQVQKIARVRGLSTESLINLLLEQRLGEISISKS